MSKDSPLRSLSPCSGGGGCSFPSLGVWAAVCLALSACTPPLGPQGRKHLVWSGCTRVPGSGPASAATAQGELGQKKPGSGEAEATGGHWALVTACVPTSTPHSGEGQKSHGCESAAAALWSPWEWQVAALGVSKQPMLQRDRLPDGQLPFPRKEHPHQAGTNIPPDKQRHSYFR